MAPGFDLAGAGGDGQVGDEDVGGLARAVADDRGVFPFLGVVDGGQRFGHGADLVELDQDGVADSFGHGFADDRRIGDEHVIPHELHPTAQLARDRLPTFPIVFRERIFDRPEGIIVEPAGVQANHFVGRFPAHRPIS